MKKSTPFNPGDKWYRDFIMATGVNMNAQQGRKDGFVWLISPVWSSGHNQRPRIQMPWHSDELTWPLRYFLPSGALITTYIKSCRALSQWWIHMVTHLNRDGMVLCSEFRPSGALVTTYMKNSNALSQWWIRMVTPFKWRKSEDRLQRGTVAGKVNTWNCVSVYYVFMMLLEIGLEIHPSHWGDWSSSELSGHEFVSLLAYQSSRACFPLNRNPKSDTS